MKSAIEEIYDNANEMFGEIPESEDYAKLKKAVGEIYGNLEMTLTEEQQKSLGNLRLAMTGLETEARKTYFIEGLKYGIKISFEALK